MKKFLLPVLMLLMGVGGGVGAGIVFAPEPEIEDLAESALETDALGADQSAIAPEVSGNDAEVSKEPGAVEYLDMSNQFIIPLLDSGDVNGIVVVSLSLELVEGAIEQVNRLEPKIRDKFLQVLFTHANNGGFSGNFTEFYYIQSLKEELLRNAIVVAGHEVTEVLILDLLRQQP